MQKSIFSIITELSQVHGAINLGQGFPEFDCHPDLIKLVEKYLNASKNQYAPMAGVDLLRTAIAKKLENIHKHSIDPNTQICITAGATQGIFTAIQSLISEGDEVIIIEPAYDSYIPSVRSAGGVPIIYQLNHPDYKVDWQRFESLITHKTKAIIINTPHNPTGTIFRQEDLEALDAIMKNKNIFLISDEVYEHIIFDNEIHQSVIKYPNLFEKSLAIYSFGKTFHVTGWKIGYVVGPAHLIDSSSQSINGMSSLSTVFYSTPLQNIWKTNKTTYPYRASSKISATYSTHIYPISILSHWHAKAPIFNCTIIQQFQIRTTSHSPRNLLASIVLRLFPFRLSFLATNQLRSFASVLLRKIEP